MADEIISMLEGSVMLRVRQLRKEENAAWERYFELQEQWVEIDRQERQVREQMEAASNRASRLKRRIEKLGEPSDWDKHVAEMRALTDESSPFTTEGDNT